MSLNDIGMDTMELNQFYSIVIANISGRKNLLRNGGKLVQLNNAIP